MIEECLNAVWNDFMCEVGESEGMGVGDSSDNTQEFYTTGNYETEKETEW